MAIFRKVHTSFWSDSFTSDLSVDQKLFYLYLLTNERTRQCGVYEITKKQISFDLGYSIDKVSILLKYFIGTGKIRYNENTKELAIGNWLKYNSSTSPKVKSCIDKEFKLVKDTVLIEYVKSMDTQSQEEQEEEEQEEEQEQKEINIEFSKFWNLYNKKVGDKNKIEKKWNKLKDDERQKIIDTLPNFLNSIKDKQYLPYPETYLNNKRWQDEINTTELKKEYTLYSPLGSQVFNLTESELEEFLAPRRKQDEGDSLWVVLNRVQESVLKGGYSITNKKNKVRRAKSIKNIQQDIKLNQQVWELAETFA